MKKRQVCPINLSHYRGSPHLLRTYWEHNRAQVDATKRQKAIQALAELSGKPGLVADSELDKTDWQKAASALVGRITNELLEPLQSALRRPKP
jgi:hypothetical protein